MICTQEPYLLCRHYKAASSIWLSPSRTVDIHVSGNKSQEPTQLLREKHFRGKDSWIRLESFTTFVFHFTVSSGLSLTPAGKHVPLLSDSLSWTLHFRLTRRKGGFITHPASDCLRLSTKGPIPSCQFHLTNVFEP